MTSITVMVSSITYRTRAIRDAGGMMTREEPFADVPLLMRIAQGWDIGYINRPLVAFRVHDQTETTRLVSPSHHERDERDRLLRYGQIMFDRRVGFLEQARLPSKAADRYRSLAALRFLADRAGLGGPWLQTSTEFVRIARQYPGILGHPIALRFIGAQLGGRALRRATAGLLSVLFRRV
jgi:hypothetical protein